MGRRRVIPYPPPLECGPQTPLFPSHPGGGVSHRCRPSPRSALPAAPYGAPPTATPRPTHRANTTVEPQSTATISIPARLEFERPTHPRRSPQLSMLTILIRANPRPPPPTVLKWHKKYASVSGHVGFWGRACVFFIAEGRGEVWKCRPHRNELAGSEGTPLQTKGVVIQVQSIRPPPPEWPSQRQRNPLPPRTPLRPDRYVDKGRPELCHPNVHCAYRGGEGADTSLSLHSRHPAPVIDHRN